MYKHIEDLVQEFDAEFIYEYKIKIIANNGEFFYIVEADHDIGAKHTAQELYFDANPEGRIQATNIIFKSSLWS